MIFKTDNSQQKPLLLSYSEIRHKHLMIKLKVSFLQQTHSCILHLPVLTRKFLHQMTTAPFTSSNNIMNRANSVQTDGWDVALQHKYREILKQFQH